MLGVCLLFVGIVLINNGMCALYHVDGILSIWYREIIMLLEQDCCSALHTFS